MWQWVIYAGLGLVVGILSGMGIGGGAILIPALTMFFGISQHGAQNINLLYFIPTAAIALIAHIRARRVETKILWKILLPGIGLAVIGAIIALRLDAQVLRRIFGWFLMIMGIAEMKKGWKKMDYLEDNENNEKTDFVEIKEKFIAADTDGKVDLYVEARGLSQLQYRELLNLFPIKELYKLEEALA
ncbi:MAG: sulfite exporter TauE/SafE family protein [Defluviitaleaceae bacterium]|nr:sulfite exporter TauE/SafE family protein [Defluviitaleaceae bacterium]